MRLSRAPVVSIALIRGRATGNGRNNAMRSDLELATAYRGRRFSHRPLFYARPGEPARAMDRRSTANSYTQWCGCVCPRSCGCRENGCRHSLRLQTGKNASRTVRPCSKGCTRCAVRSRILCRERVSKPVLSADVFIAKSQPYSTRVGHAIMYIWTAELQIEELN